MAPEQFGFNNFNEFDFNLDYYYSDYSAPLKFKLVDKIDEKEFFLYGSNASQMYDMSSPVSRKLFQ